MQAWSITPWILALVAGAAAAENLEPSSVLVYPVFYGSKSKSAFSIVSVTNTNRVLMTQTSMGGTTRVLFEFIDVVPAGSLACLLQDRAAVLTPADTLSVLTSCFTSGLTRGYLVVSAQDPLQRPWSHDFLVGSEVVVRLDGQVSYYFSLPAIGFDSPIETGKPTDVDGDGHLDFDGIEYEGVPDELIVDSFIASSSLELALLNLTGGATYKAAAQVLVWNDNEFPLSANFGFDCWMEKALVQISAVFDPVFLANNTPHDPDELDLDCDGFGDLETGWAIVRGVLASNSSDAVKDPALLGALTGARALDGGRPLWHSQTTQDNGKFLNFAAIDPEL